MHPEILFTEDISAAQTEILGIAGRVNQVFTDKIFVAELPDDFLLSNLKYSILVKENMLSGISKIAFDAWNSFRKKSEKKRVNGFIDDKRSGLSWDADGFTPPLGIKNSGGDAEVMTFSAVTSTSRYMIGGIAVGIVIVSGEGELKFTETEVQKIISEVQEGLQFLSTAEPKAKISFVYDIHMVDVKAVPGDTGEFETSESPWRDEALDRMGYTASRQGSVEFVNSLLQTKATQWAYVAYFTKYPLHHFAYAIDEKIVMNYYNAGWGINFINGVFAHETCHIFGAADEYGDCSCDSTHGELEIENGNCRSCSTGFVNCLMEANDLVLCEWTRKQIGWDDSLLNYV